MKCPTCKREVMIDEPFMPFCSERCKLLDLGAWATEKYVISTPISNIAQSSEQQEDDE